MKIDSGVLQRLNEVIIDSSLSRRQFALGIGHAPSTITEIFSKRIKTLSGSIITILELKYGINPDWLSTGVKPKYVESVKVNDQTDLELLKKFRSLNKSNKTMVLRFADTLFSQQSNESEPQLQAAKGPGEPYAG